MTRSDARDRDRAGLIELVRGDITEQDVDVVVNAGIYGWPLESAAEIALTTIAEAAPESVSVRMVLFDQRTYDVFAAATPGSP